MLTLYLVLDPVITPSTEQHLRCAIREFVFRMSVRVHLEDCILHRQLDRQRQVNSVRMKVVESTCLVEIRIKKRDRDIAVGGSARSVGHCAVRHCYEELFW